MRVALQMVRQLTMAIVIVAVLIVMLQLDIFVSRRLINVFLYVLILMDLVPIPMTVDVVHLRVRHQPMAYIVI